jgi:hypothetical protein
MEKGSEKNGEENEDDEAVACSGTRVFQAIRRRLGAFLKFIFFSQKGILVT